RSTLFPYTTLFRSEALALEMKVDPIDLRMRSFIQPEQFPYETTTGWTYDSGNYAETMKVAMDIAGYAELRRGRAAQAHGHPRPRHERRRGSPRAPLGQGRGQHQRPDAGSGSRDDLRAD